MCGLFGIVDLSRPGFDPGMTDAARQARDVLHHRGPDQSGEFIADNLYIGHRRLSILDLSQNGRQPMVSRDKATVIAANGEIYNYRALRWELGEDVFESNSDSEVLLHGYRKWGIDGLLERIDGMYAFCIYDARERKLFCARDRAGVKPLYYAVLGGYVIWASELKAIEAFCAGRIPLQADETALFDFLTYRYIPAPKTAYRNVFKLEPAQLLTLDCVSADMQTRRYWHLNPETRDIGSDQAASRLRSLCEASVREQMVSDVPVGFFLSGGLDSSVVVAEAACLCEKAQTFSIGMHGKALDETGYAEIVADKFDTQHVTDYLGADDAYDLDSLMARLYDEPFGDTSGLPTHHVSRLARRNVTVVLTGDGGDELFGGYRWYKRFSDFRKCQIPLRMLFEQGVDIDLARQTDGLARKICSRLDLYCRFDPLALYAALMGGVYGAGKKRWRDRLGIDADYDDHWHFRRYYKPELPELKRLQYLDFHTYLPDDILTKVDRASMDVSLECRVPFLSRELVEFAFSLPEDIIYHEGALKGGLKYAYRDILPEEVLQRGKEGFSIPYFDWGRKNLGKYGSFEEAFLAQYVDDRLNDMKELV